MYKIEPRNIALYVILTIITCGFFGLYWLYKLAEDMNNLRGDEFQTSPGLVVVFSIITCGIYEMIWFYKAGATVDDIRIKQNMAPGSKGILYLLLVIFRLGIVSYGLLQNDFNEMSEGMDF